MADLISPATAPFAVAIILMLLITALEIIGLVFGLSPSSAIDSLLPEVDVDIDMDLDTGLESGLSGGPLDGDIPVLPDAPNAGPVLQFLDWLCVGKVPALVLLIILLTAFGTAGFAIQGTVQSLIGAPLPAMIAAIPAILAALPATRFSALAIAKILPKEETEAVSHKQFVGKVATIIRGEAQKGTPAEAKFTDSFGTTHYLLVEPDEHGESFRQGDDVILVKQLGGKYAAIANTNAALTR